MTQVTSLKGIRKEVSELIRESVGDAHATYYPMLFVHLLNSHAAAWLLNQILYWSERTHDPDGWFYKSYADWEREGCLSRSQVERALRGDANTQRPRVTLSDLGVETEVRRAPTGSPTMHYRLNKTLFLSQLAAFLEQHPFVEAQESDRSICENPTDGNAPIPQVEVMESHTSGSAETTPQTLATEITAESSPLDDDVNFYKAFEERFGKLKDDAMPALRDKLARLGRERVVAVLERCTKRGRSWAYVLKALQNEAAEPTDSATLFLVRILTRRQLTRLMKPRAGNTNHINLTAGSVKGVNRSSIPSATDKSTVPRTAVKRSGARSRSGANGQRNQPRRWLTTFLIW